MSRQIVLVVGAGASKDLHREFQLGRELIRDVADRVTDRTSLGRPYLSTLLEKLGFDYSIRDHFVRSLDAYARVAESPSIDEFLNEVVSYPEFAHVKDGFTQIGKFAIVFHMLGSEGALKNSGLSGSSWIHKLATFIDTNGLLNRSRSAKCDLKLVTFNYDRCVEHYLHTLHKKRSRAVASYIRDSLTHVYGTVGNLPWQRGRGTFDFGEGNDKWEKIFENKNAIRLMYSERSGPGAQQAAEWIHAGETHSVAAFGFSFDLINHRLLRLQDLGIVNSRAKLIANVYPFGSDGFAGRRAMAKKIRSIKHDAEITYLGCADFLNHVFERASK